MPARLHVGVALRAEGLAVLAAAAALAGCGSAAPTPPPGGTGARTTEGAPPVLRTPAGAVTRRAVVRRLRGRRVTVGGRRLALDPATLTCVGVGPPASRGRAATWSRFRCVQPTFPPGATVGPDLVLFVAVREDDALVVDAARLTRY